MSSSPFPFDVVPAGDAAVRVVVATAISDAATDRVIAVWRALEAARAPFVVDVHPAYTSLLVEFDLARADHGRVERLLRRLAIDARKGAPGRTVAVPVTYDGADLDDVAAHAGLTRAEVVALHTGAAYRVAFLGFAPGFAYLLGLPPRLATPRLPSPRARVPAGSVAIGGAQTAVYPTDSPGGWRLVGRTTRDLAPGWVAPGDVVRFVDAGGAR